MSLTQAQLMALHPELQHLLRGARLQRLREPAPQKLACDFYQPRSGSQHSLLIDLSQGQSWLMLQPRAQPGLASPSAWCMLLRKHLLNQVLQAITRPADDRLLMLHFAQGQTLILELSGRHANLFLRDAEGHVLGAARRDASTRQLTKGQPYLLPTPPVPRPPRDALQLEHLPADGSRSATLWTHYLQQRQQAQQRQQIQSLLRGLGQQISRLNQRLQQAWADLAREAAAADWQQQGELLRGAFGQVSPGQRAVSIPDYYQPGAPLRQIALNPALDLAGNIQRCFQQARRCARAAEYALKALPGLEAEQAQQQALQNRLEAWLQRLSSGPLPQAEQDELQALWQTEAQPSRPAQGQKTPQAVHQPAWRFRSLSGALIWVGKTDRDNQILLQNARGSDFWLHLRDGSSAHVLVPCAKKQTPDPDTLLDAATLVLAHSPSYRTPFEGLKAEVWVARVHQLQRPKGAKPGQVQVLPGARSLLLRFEPERLQRLQASRC